MDLSRTISRKPDWAWLPENVLFVILTELFLFSDLVSFSSVCKRWRSVCRHRFQDLNIMPNMLFSRRLPMLLIPTIDDTESVRNLYSLPNGQVYDLRLPMPYNNRCIGSCHGWLIFLECVSFVVTLFNPFYFGNIKGTISLPPFLPAMDFFQSNNSNDVSPEYYICKAVLSADPVSSPNYTVMLIYGEFRGLAYYMPGDESWTCIHVDPLVYDLIYSDGYFTAVNFCGKFFISNPEAGIPQLQSISEPLFVGPARNFNRRYIVLSYDNHTLFQVVRSIELCSSSNGDNFFRTLGFSVYRFGQTGSVREMTDWSQYSNIGDEALFVGDSYSYSVRASDFPGIIPNSIYFTDDYHGFSAVYGKPYRFKGPSDAGVFLIGCRSFRAHYDPNDLNKLVLPPIWILPTI